LKTVYKWIYPQNNIDENLFSEIKKTAGSQIIAQLLINRGITSAEQARNFLDLDNAKISSPYVFPDMEKAVKRINEAIEKQEHIVVFGDFDADGVTSTSLLYKTLKLLDANASFYLPDRSEEGHGLNGASVCKLISSRKAKLIITVDCGISNVNEIKLAKSLGSEVIITDHHEAQEEIPPAYAIINPKMADCRKRLEDGLCPDVTPFIAGNQDFPPDLKYLAGVGVAYKLALALLEANNKEHFHDEIFYFVALGTVGDVVPLLGENRIFVRQGMNLISQKRPAAIGKILELGGYKPGKKISASTIAFGIIPKINAIGRLMDASPVVDFLLTEEEEKLQAFASELNENNKKRQQMCEETFNKAELKIKEEINLEKDKAIILADKDWHAGIIGIVASKLVEKYYRPVFMVSLNEEKNEARGSARSVESLNLFETLSEFADLFVQFGGHAFAAGFSFDLSKISYNELREKLYSSVNNRLSTESLKPELKIDAELQPCDVTESLIKELERLEPFGESNPHPVFSMSNLTLLQVKKMGAKKNHLKLFISDDNGLKFEAVWWGKENPHVEELEKISIAFTPTLNVFNDNVNIQLIIKDLKLASDKDIEYEEVDGEGVLEIEFESMPDSCEAEPVSADTSENVTLNLIQGLSDSELLLESQDGKILNQVQNDRGSGIKWHDKRNSTGFKKDFLEYIKSLKNNATIFAETQRSLNAFEHDINLKAIFANRRDIKKSDCLVIMDMPPDEKTFFDIINRTQAKEIHFIGLNSEIDSVETVKKFTSMLKYAFNNKDGIIDIEQMASLLVISSESAMACLELLDASGVIEVIEINEEIIKFNFLGSAELSTILEQLEYEVFLDFLEESKKFRQKLLVLEITRIQELLGTKNLEYSL